MLTKITTINIHTGIVLSFIIFITIGFLWKGMGYDDHFNVLITIASFFFGIFIAFSIAGRHAKFSRVNEILKSDAALMLSIYQTSQVFGEKTNKEVKELLDDYLISQIDYYLEDFKYSNKKFTKIFQFFVSLEPKNDKQRLAYQNILNLLSNSQSNRKLVELLVGEKMLRFEWVSILSLLTLVLFLIFYFNDGSLLSIVLSAILASSSIILIFVMRDLDNLRWKEDTSIWQPLHNLFLELELIPYYPSEVVKDKRVKLGKGQKVRLVEYPDPYPDMTNKIVKIVEV